ncbi:MAG: hypothetical protein KGO05_16645 [Chloroflexota bacterium]|nr:hypothetical protein [Chloroflexota bacterium]
MFDAPASQPLLPGFPPFCPAGALCPLEDWISMDAVLIYALLACVALLALSLIRVWRQRRGMRAAAVALLAVVLCAVIAIVYDRWLLAHNPQLYFGAHFTLAVEALIRQSYIRVMSAAAGPIGAIGAAFVIGVCVTADRLIHAALPSSPEHLS